jgi:endonuclease YncB( thermonuclease family)
MRTFLTVTFVSAVWASMCAYVLANRPEPAWTTDAYLVEVYDGDTLTVEVRRRIKVRLLDCWAPEIRTRDRAEKVRGFASRAHLRSLVKPGDKLTLSVPGGEDLGKRFSFGRILGRVWADGSPGDLSSQQVAAGHATKTKER